ncbi:DUF7507 domain-containing protein, partial [Tabrizicola oligotrophica]
GLVDAAGDIITYEITVTNDGNVTLTNVTITDPLTGLDHFVGDLAPGGTHTVEATYTVQQADIDGDGIDLNGLVDGDGDVDNTATADSDETEEVSDSEVVGIVYDPVLLIDKVVTDVGGDGPDGVVNAAGDIITYEITVTNDGNVTLTNVTITDPLTGLDHFVGDLAPGGTHTVEATYTVQQADIDGDGIDLNGLVDGDGDVDNTATADSDET